MGVIVKTTNGGQSWVGESCPGVSDNYVAVSFPANANTGYALASSGRVIKTTNSGTTWTRAASPDTTGILSTVYFRTASTGFAAGASPVIHKTTDGGNTWHPVSTTGFGFYALKFPTDVSTGYACGDYGRVYKTTDGGASWIQSVTYISDRLNRITFPVDANTGYAVGEGKRCIKTTDAGRRGSLLTCRSEPESNAVSFPHSNSTGYVAGSGAMILKTAEGGVWVEDKPVADSRLPIPGCRLRVEPIRAGDWLSLQLTADGSPPTAYGVEVYDATGREVRGTPNPEQRVVRSNRTGELLLDLRGLAEGVYFVSVAAGKQRATARIVLVR